jgi:PAS domain S-box-containing protein
LRGRVAELEALNHRREQAEKRAKLQSRLLDAVGQAVIVTDLRGAITYWNRFAEELYGWSAQDVLGRSIVDVTPSEGFRERADEIMAELKAGKSWSGEFLVRRRDGTSFPAMVTNTPVYDEARRLVGIIGVSMDVTERRRAEESLRFRKALLEAQSEASLEGILVVSGEKRILSFNKCFVEMWEIPEEVLETHSDEAALRSVEDKLASPREFLARVAYLYDHPNEESREDVRLRDGRTFERYSAPVKSEDGAYYGRAWFFRDVTERRRAEEALEKQNVLLQTILKQAADAVIVCDAQGKLTFANAAARRLALLDSEETSLDIAPEVWGEAYDPSGRRIPLEEWSIPRALRGETSVSTEARMVRPDGSFYDILISAAPLRSNHDSIMGAVATFVEITERKRMEQALARTLQDKSDFLADVSHELRTPLTVIRGSAEVGLELERNCVHREALEDIVKESTHVQRMVEDLLFLARSDSGELPLDLEEVDVPHFLAELAGRAAALAREWGATLKLGLTGEGRLRIDRARVEQAVLNLVDNAAKYGFTGEPIALTSAIVSGELRIEVADKGRGVPEAALAHIFDRFYRVDGVLASKRGGSGLGLPIAKSIVGAHGGRIEAKSRVGEGTTMSLYIPLLDEPF